MNSSPPTTTPRPQPLTGIASTRRPVVQSVVLAALALLLVMLVAEGGNTSSSEAFAINSAATAAHIRQLAADRRQRGLSRPPATSDLETADVAIAEGEHGGLRRIRSRLRPRPGRALRWLAIGDSITQGIAAAEDRRKQPKRDHPRNGTCSYLGPLTASLARGDAPEVTFVGPHTEAAYGPIPSSCPTPHPRHAATWGITAAAVSSNENYRAKHRALHLGLDGTPRPPLNRGARVYDWVREYRPDVVSFLIGTNDLSAGTPHGTLLDDLLQPMVVQALRAAEDATAFDSHAHAEARHWEKMNRCESIVLLLMLLPRSDAVHIEVENFNEKLERRDRSWLRDRCVEVVSTNDGLEANDPEHFYDGLHPGHLGESIVAANILLDLNFADGKHRSQPVAIASNTSSATGAAADADGSIHTGQATPDV